MQRRANAATGMTGYNRAMKDKDAGSTGLPDAKWFSAVRRSLVAWYRQNARDLPWRGVDDPYRVWVSEIMLQQTQVNTVREYFPRFIDRFPTIADLAQAPQSEVLRLWEGLGYYRRARQLHAAAIEVVGRHKGQFPSEPEDVQALPGIGRYTAGAILSIGFDQRRPIIETNTARVWRRLLALRGHLGNGAEERLLWLAAERVLPEQKGAGTVNQALMELGAIICRPREPRCLECPVFSCCLAAKAGLQREIPVTRAGPVVESVFERVVVIRKGSWLLLTQREQGSRWGGLWDFVRFPIDTGGIPPSGKIPPAIARATYQEVRRLTGLQVDSLVRLGTIQHQVTRFKITLEAFAANFVAGKLVSPVRGARPPSADTNAATSSKETAKNGSFADLRWMEIEGIERLPLHVSARRVAKLAIERATSRATNTATSISKSRPRPAGKTRRAAARQA